MRHLYIILVHLFLSATLVAQQKHFKIDLAISYKLNKIYCDVVAKEDYWIAGYQFGFNYDIAHLNFVDIINNDLPEFSLLGNYNTCEDNVLISCINTLATNIYIPAGKVMFSMIFDELDAVEHHICMLPSGKNFCKEYDREVFTSDLEYFIVDDICPSYKIIDKKVVLTKVDDAPNNAYLDAYMARDQLILQCSNTDLRQAELTIYSTDGSIQTSLILNSVQHQTIPLERLASGVYVAVIKKQGITVLTKKLIK